MEGDDENNRRILFAAAWRGEEDKLKGLIDSGAVPINAVDENKVTALRFTAQYGHKELTRFLIEKCADPNLKVTVFGSQLRCNPWKWSQPKRLYYREPVLICSVLAKRDVFFIDF